MIFPLIEIFSIPFIAIAIIGLSITAKIFYEEEETAGLVFFGILSAILYSITKIPPINPYFILVYILCGLVWTLVFWYLKLRENRQKLLLSNEKYELRLYGVVLEDGKTWVPKHPDKDVLVSYGLLWIFSAPLYLGRTWILLLIDIMRGLMDKIRLSFSVEKNI